MRRFRRLVEPGDEKASLLWLKLRAGTSGVDDVLGAPMPVGLPPVTPDELEAVRLWIRAGASDGGVVEGTSALLDACLGLGRQYQLQHRIHSAESVSKVLFETALKIADNRGLVHSTEPEIAQWRRVFADQVRATLRRIDAVEALAASRRAGLIE